MLTYLMFAAVIGFALVMRQRNKHKDDYRYVAAQYLMMWIMVYVCHILDYILLFLYSHYLWESNQYWIVNRVLRYSFYMS